MTPSQDIMTPQSFFDARNKDSSLEKMTPSYNARNDQELGQSQY